MPQTPPPAEMLMMMITSKWVSQAIHAAAKLGLADLVAAQPKNVHELAKATDTNADALFRLMRALASVGIFNEAQPGQFVSTPMAELLRRDAPGSMRPMAVMAGEPFEYQAWSEVLYSVKTGLPAFDRVFQQDIFHYFINNKDALAVFNDAMTCHSDAETPAILQAYDFSKINILMDVAGGHGRVIASVLQANPRMQGVLFDLSEVVAGAHGLLAKAGVAQRCKTTEGSFFDEIPQGADAIIMKHIIHDWSDESSIRILRNCRRALPSNGRMLIAEMVVAPGNDPSPAKWLDLQMLLMTQGGRERSRDEFAALFDKSGFRLERVVGTAGPLCVVEGVCI